MRQDSYHQSFVTEQLQKKRSSLLQGTVSRENHENSRFSEIETKSSSRYPIIQSKLRAPESQNKPLLAQEEDKPGEVSP
jgi:hypothetical protein